MSKELLALEDIILYLNASEPKGLYCENIETIQQALLELQSIKEANPSESLEAFGRITLHTEYDNDSHYDGLHFEDDCKLVDKALQKSEKEHKALEIIKEKECDMRWFKYCIKVNSEVETYNNGLPEYYEKLTQEEFNLLIEAV